MNMGTISYRGFIGFVFGGAISLNRMLMEENKNFWARYDYIDPWRNLYRDWKFDFIIGHTGPIPEGIIFNSGCEKFLSMDKDLKGDLEKEQNDLTDMLCHMTPKHWFMGHYHKNKEYTLRPFEKKDYELTDAMTSYLCNFVKTGNPNGEGLTEWQPSNEGQKKVLRLGEGDIRMDGVNKLKLFWTMLTNKAVGE